VAACRAGDKVGAAQQIAAVAVGFAEEELAGGRIAFIAQPAASDFAIGQALRQRQFARYRGQNALPVKLREVIGECPAEVVPDPIQHQPADDRGGRQSDHACQQQRHQ